MNNLNWFVQLLSAGLRLALPISYAALGGCISELAGVTAMGLEGMMLSGAFFAVLGSYLTGSALIGILFGLVGGALIALLQAVLCVRFRANQIVCGLGINMLGSGLTTVLLSTVFGNKGKSAAVASFSSFSLPLVSKIPIIGTLFTNDIFFYLFLLLLAGSCFAIYRTAAGLRLRAAGIHPEAVDSLGVNAIGIRYVAVLLCGALCGISGASISIGQMSFFSSGMTAGKGYIAIAAFVFGGWNPIRATLAALLFGLMEALQLRLQTYVTYPQIIQMIPYVVTVLAISINISRADPPAAVGKPYYHRTKRSRRHENKTLRKYY